MTGIIYIHTGIHAGFETSKDLVSVYSQNGMTPLMIASFKGHVDIVRLLVEAKAQLNAQREEV